MDSRGGGCCIAKYGGGGYDISTVHRIMMKFRPIAPKPANGTSSTSPEISDQTSPKSGRGRRRLTTSTTVSTNKRCNNGGSTRKRKDKTDSAVPVVTLPLLPETPTKESPAGVVSPGKTKSLPTMTWLSFGSKDEMKLDRAATMPPSSTTVVIGSCVTVECVTDTWMDVDGLGTCTNEEGRMNLERDTCPGFISDCYGRVTWTNEAYRKMATDQEDGNKGEVVVWLAMKDKAAVTAALASGTAFTCRVRVQNQRSYGYGKEKSSVTLPCDVWRLDGGDFAWRLDVTAALSLGR